MFSSPSETTLAASQPKPPAQAIPSSEPAPTKVTAPVAPKAVTGRNSLKKAVPALPSKISKAKEPDPPTASSSTVGSKSTVTAHRSTPPSPTPAPASPPARSSVNNSQVLAAVSDLKEFTASMQEMLSERNEMDFKTRSMFHMIQGQIEIIQRVSLHCLFCDYNSS